jgi:protein transport protein SEC23
MQHMITCTGGLMVKAETFGHDAFRRSLHALMRAAPGSTSGENGSGDTDAALSWALNATLEVTPCSHLALRGAIGPLASLERRGAGSHVAEPPIGLGGTTAWKLNALDATTATALFFQPTAALPERAPAAGSPLHFQVRRLYRATVLHCFSRAHPL